MTPDGCSRSAGGSDGIGGAYIGGGESVAVRGMYDDVMVMKKRMNSPMPAPKDKKNNYIIKYQKK